MNEFTKEELEEIDICVFNWNINHKGMDRFTELRNKIQSLIANYCDHTWTDGSGNHMFCGKCHAYGGKK
ncbi:hypothetical protein [Thiocapsa sp. N5-Cardenillas]|uniref:hypothetical protein n=1 Tax=Thiocapsa sp. N5-Cardenillas TaxID=3137397 RepID=UPI0035AF74B7